MINLGDRQLTLNAKYIFIYQFNILNKTKDITKMSDTFITVIYHTMSLTVLYTCRKGNEL
jgi:hypothetical protein